MSGSLFGSFEVCFAVLPVASPRRVARVSIPQTALCLFTYTYMKFLSFLTQRLSFCSTNEVSSILKEKRSFINKSRKADEQYSIPEFPGVLGPRSLLS